VSVNVEAPPADQVLSDEAFYRLVEQDCKARGKGAPESFCAMTGKGSGEVGPVETMPRTETDSK
jgi:hypothetical protein